MEKLSLDNNQKCWLPNIFDANNIEKPHNKQIQSVLSQLKDEYFSEINSNGLYWNSRPSRLFWLDPDKDEELFELERSRITKVLKYNYYKKGILEKYFSELEDDEALDKIKKIPNQDFGVVFPVKIEANNEYLPSVCFSGFSKINSNELNIFEKPKKALKNKFDINITENIIPRLILYSKIDGNSYQLAFITFILLEKHKHLFNALPKICCTGVVDENGFITKIDYAKEKLEAAKQMGFDFIIFPESNRKDVVETDNCIFFNNILDFESWLIELASNKAKKRINHWLMIGGDEPSQDEFNTFFENTPNKSVSYWQNSLKYVSTNEAIKRIKAISKAYLNYINPNCSDNNLIYNKISYYKNTLPSHLFYSLIPEIINNQNKDTCISDYLYKQINAAIESQSPDFAIATRLLREKEFIKNIHKNLNLREKYPQLLCFYFKHPAELIFILSSIENLTIKEKKLLEITCAMLENNASDDEIINKALNMLISVSEFNYETKAESITHSQRLALLEVSLDNFKRQKAIDFAHIESVITKYKYKIEEEVKDKSKLDNQKKQNKNKLKNDSKYNYQTSISLPFTNKSLDSITYLPLGINAKLFKLINNNIESKLLVTSSTNHYSFNSYRNIYLKYLFNSFKTNKMAKLITEATSFFYGKYIVKTTQNKLKILTKKQFDFPYSIGLLCQNSNVIQKDNPYFHKICISLKKDIKRISLRQLMWLYFLPKPYRDEVSTDLEKHLITIKDKINHHNEKNQSKDNKEFKCEFDFIVALLGFTSLLDKDNNFEAQGFEFLKNRNVSLTKTYQLLFPIYCLLKHNNPCSDFYNLNNQLNNSRFIIEFIRVFALNSNINEMFQPIHGFSDFEKQLFDSMVIVRLFNESQDNDNYLLSNYILNHIKDFPNIIFALELLEQA